MGATRHLLISAGLGLAICLAAPAVHAQTADNVLVVINENSKDSLRVGEYYVKKRGVPDSNVVRIKTGIDDAIERNLYAGSIEAPIAAALSRGGLQDRILYVVLTKGIPLRITGTGGAEGTASSVDSELTLMYRRMTGENVFVRGRVENPFYLGERAVKEMRPFTRRDHDVYLVTRLDGFTAEDVIALIDRGSAPAAADGRIVLDMSARLGNRTGEDWLEEAARRLTAGGHGDQVVLESTVKPARGVQRVLGYYSWGSSDPRNRERQMEMAFVPGAIAATFVGTDARTFKEPPPAWKPTEIRNQASVFGGSAQSLLGDLIREGVTGAAGQVAEPYLQSAVRPEILFPAYLSGANLVEAFYAAMPHLSWQTVVIGDPLCAPFRKESVARADVDGGVDAETGLPAFFARRRLAAAVADLPGIPERAVVLAVRGDTFLNKGDQKGAQGAYEEASALAPNIAPVQMQLAQMYERAERYADAVERYRQVIEVQPKNAIALNNLAYRLAVNGNAPKEALPLAQRAVEVAPGNPTILDTLAWVQHLLGDHGAAVGTMATALKGDPKNAEIRLHAAIIYAASGARAVARDQLQEALKLQPSLGAQPEVEKLRQELEAPAAPR